MTMSKTDSIRVAYNRNSPHLYGASTRSQPVETVQNVARL